MTVGRDEALDGFLGLLRLHPGGLTPDDLKRRIPLDDEHLHKARRIVEEAGFKVAETEQGLWVLEHAPDRLVPNWIRAGLRTDRLGDQIYYREEVESTQDVAFELMVEGRPHGTLVVAEHQTSGRGRTGREWVSVPRKCVLFSLLLDLEPPGTFAAVLTIATATAVARAIQNVADLPPTIKFPNDILVRGRKVAGILIETKDYGGHVPRAVVGVGINVNAAQEDFPPELQGTATSLQAERRNREPVSRARILRQVLEGMERWLEQIADGNYDELESQWRRFSFMQDKDVTFLHDGQEVSGRVRDMNLREGLLVGVRGGGGPRRFRLEHLTDLRLAEPAAAEAQGSGESGSA